MTEGNPYAAPSREAQSPTRRPVAHAFVKWIFLACLVMPLPFALMGSPGVVPVPLVAAAALHLYWVFRTWTMLPAEDRMKRSGAIALSLLIIPIYQSYWMFVMNLCIEKHLARRLSQRATHVRAPSVLAWLVPLAFSVPFFVGGLLRVHAVLPLFVFVPFLTFAWMYRVDGCFAVLRGENTR